MKTWNKTVNSNGVSVAIAITEIAPLTYKIDLSCGATRREHVHTVGAASGQIGSYTPASLRAEILGVAQQLADEVSKYELASQAAIGLDLS